MGRECRAGVGAGSCGVDAGVTFSKVNAMQCVAVCCSVLQWQCGRGWTRSKVSALRCVAVCCGVLQWRCGHK